MAARAATMMRMIACLSFDVSLRYILAASSTSHIVQFLSAYRSKEAMADLFADQEAPAAPPRRRRQMRRWPTGCGRARSTRWSARSI
jgi:hypothetical protein